MGLKEHTQWLLENSYAVLHENIFILTKKFYEELHLKEARVVISKNTVLPPTIPTITTEQKKKDIWHQFCTDADIPHRVPTAGGTYTVKQYAPSAAVRLVQIISDPTINYQRLVASTMNYYKTVSYKAILSNYLLKEIWKSEYDNWKEGSTIKVDDGSSRWES